MFIYCNLVVLMLVLTSMSQVHAVIGGHEAAAHSRPYMVLLERTIDDKEAYCGGFILSEDFVMTAAHCKAESYKVFVGVHSFHENNLKSYSVEQDFPHEDFNANKAINDIMLLKLSEKIKFNEHVKAIALADQCYDGLPKCSCSISGWGHTANQNTHLSYQLMEVNVTLINDEICAAEKWYCSKGEKGPGSGDGGGPLVCEDGKAYRVVSASWLKEAVFETFVYTKIPDYREWIDGITKNLEKRFLATCSKH